MGLNKSKGNMYEFITHTWNVVKGECYHDCSYCYMKRWGKLNPARFDEKELKTDLGTDNFIFVGSSNDMFTVDVEWTQRILDYCNEYPDNKYFFQSKNTFAFQNEWLRFPKNSVFCTTIETNRFYQEFMGNTPYPRQRAFSLPLNNYITIEPIMDFDLIDLLTLLKVANPKQVNIGADSGNNNLPEPPKEKILELIHELEKFTKVKQKKNLKRLLQ
jgi:hypothetical protein